jgi:hypothetical protein
MGHLAVKENHAGDIFMPHFFAMSSFLSLYFFIQNLSISDGLRVRISNATLTLNGSTSWNVGVAGNDSAETFVVELPLVRQSSQQKKRDLLCQMLSLASKLFSIISIQPYQDTCWPITCSNSPLEPFQIEERWSLEETTLVEGWELLLEFLRKVLVKNVMAELHPQVFNTH